MNLSLSLTRNSNSIGDIIVRLHVRNSVVRSFGQLIVILSVVMEPFNILRFTIIKCERLHMKVYIYNRTTDLTFRFEMAIENRKKTTFTCSTSKCKKRLNIEMCFELKNKFNNHFSSSKTSMNSALLA